jgi:hypothetical protein
MTYCYGTDAMLKVSRFYKSSLKALSFFFVKIVTSPEKVRVYVCVYVCRTWKVFFAKYRNLWYLVLECGIFILDYDLALLDFMSLPGRTVRTPGQIDSARRIKVRLIMFLNVRAIVSLNRGRTLERHQEWDGLDIQWIRYWAYSMFDDFPIKTMSLH